MREYGFSVKKLSLGKVVAWATFWTLKEALNYIDEEIKTLTKRFNADPQMIEHFKFQIEVHYLPVL